LRDHLLAVWRATGRMPEEMAEPPIPRGCRTIIEAFSELHSTRSSNGFGPAAISFHDILAWQTVFNVTLSPFELRCIFAMDSAALTEINDK